MNIGKKFWNIKEYALNYSREVVSGIGKSW